MPPPAPQNARERARLVIAHWWERAQRRDPTLTQARVASVFGRSQPWFAKVLAKGPRLEDLDGFALLMHRDPRQLVAQSDSVMETERRADDTTASGDPPPQSAPDQVGAMPFDPHAGALASLFLSIPPERREAAFDALQRDIRRWAARKGTAREGTTDGD